jgi:hypothetical protein
MNKDTRKLKREYRKSGYLKSMRQWAKVLATAGDSLAKGWLDRKRKGQ